MLLDQISLLTAIAFSSAALMVTLFVNWLSARSETYLLSWTGGMALVVGGIALYGLSGDDYIEWVQFASFACLLSGFALVYAGARQYRSGTVNIPLVSGLWLASILVTAAGFLLGLSGLGTISLNFASAVFLALSAREYWVGRAEVRLPMVANAVLYAVTAVSFVLCGVVLVATGQFVLEARPNNWAEDINAIMVIIGLTGIGALSLTLNQQRAARHHRRESMTDPLTGLVNRRALFADHAGKIVEPGIAVIMLDLDHFKAINDQLGHAVGDAVLQHFADILRDNTRATDTAARLGGEEFCIVLRRLSSRSASAAAERIRASFAASPTRTGPALVTATVSAGIAISTGEGEAFETLLNRADDALYEAKSAGRNRVHPPGLRLVADATPTAERPAPAARPAPEDRLSAG